MNATIKIKRDQILDLIKCDQIDLSFRFLLLIDQKHTNMNATIKVKRDQILDLIECDQILIYRSAFYF